MAIRALDLSGTRRFTCKDDKDDPTIFTLGTLSSRDKGAIRDAATSVSIDAPDPADKGKNGKSKVDKINTTIERSKINFEACRRGIKGWENFIHPVTNQPVPFETVEREIDGKPRAVVKPELLDIIPLDVILEIGDAILGDEADLAGDLGN